MIASAVAVSGADLEELIEKYLKASNRHDLATMRAMTAEDAVWQLGPDLLVGRDAVLTPNACDAGANTRLKWSNIVVRDNAVEFDLVERNDILRALGVREVRHFVRVTFEDGLVKRKELRKPSIGAETLPEKGPKFRAWLRETHPEVLPRLWSPEDKFIYSQEGCRVLAKLAAEWVSQHKSP